ncbi:cell-surface large adhesin [Streptomyces malaysiensis subsp. malaysiensis]|nr:cell-surface large adhesin [Streptomyces malaysiensis]
MGFRGRVPRVPVRRLHARVPRASRGTRAFELPVGFAPSGHPGAWPSGAPGSVSAGGFPWARVPRAPARDLPARVSGVSARPGFRGVRSPRARARGRRAEVSDPGAARRPGGPVVRRSGVRGVWMSVRPGSRGPRVPGRPYGRAAGAFPVSGGGAPWA